MYEIANARGDSAAALAHLRASVDAMRSLPGTEDAAADQLFAIADLTQNSGDEAAAPRLRLHALELATAARTRQIAERPNDVQPYLARATLLARAGRFKEAAADWEQATRLDPSQHWAWYVLACDKLYLGDEAGYRAACEQMQRRFADDARREVRERTAKVALLLPGTDPAKPVGDPAVVARLVEGITAPGVPASLVPWFDMTKALAEYRGGHYDAAVGWAARARTITSASDLASVDFITAMSHFKAGHETPAREALRAGLERFDTKVPKPTFDDLAAPENYFVCDVLRREAVALIDPQGK
jgi:tetratricopeptide (TPR) repeat protein